MNRTKVSTLLVTGEQETGKNLAKQIFANGWQGHVSVLSQPENTWQELTKNLAQGAGEHPRILVLDEAAPLQELDILLSRVREHPILRTLLVVLIGNSDFPEIRKAAQRHNVAGLFARPNSESDWEQIAVSLSGLWNICEFV